MTANNSINVSTAGIVGFSGTAFVETAATNHAVLVGGSTTSTFSNVGPSATTGQVLQSAGSSANPAFSTATYPATATGTGKILRADGTNWAASTATYPDTAGTSGNVLTSDGTNWSSSAPAAGGLTLNGSLVGIAANLADSTTYYFAQAQVLTFNTTSITASCRFYVTSTCTLNKVYGVFRVPTTVGSGESCTLFVRKNDTSNTNITTSLVMSANENTFNATSLGISLVAGDYIVFGLTTPAWNTNPLGVSLSLTFSN